MPVRCQVGCGGFRAGNITAGTPGRRASWTFVAPTDAAGTVTFSTCATRAGNGDTALYVDGANGWNDRIDRDSCSYNENQTRRYTAGQEMEIGVQFYNLNDVGTVRLAVTCNAQAIVIPPAPDDPDRIPGISNQAIQQRVDTITQPGGGTATWLALNQVRCCHSCARVCCARALRPRAVPV